MITEKELNSLVLFSRIRPKLYSDLDEYVITQENGQWSLWLCNETTGERVEKIIDIESLTHLREVYELIEGVQLS